MKRLFSKVVSGVLVATLTITGLNVNTLNATADSLTSKK